MREIKFRAYHKIEKKMADVDNIWLFDDGTNKGYRIHLVGSPFHDYSDDVELMQYTGLKDKHGKEIYEGDMVEFLFSEWTHSRIRLVQWDSTVGRFSTTQDDDEDGEYLGEIPFCEVIGNIYENPELLEAKDGE